MVEFYRKQMNDRLFTKNNSEYPRYGVGGLRYRSIHSLKLLFSLEVGESIVINKDTIKRIV